MKSALLKLLSPLAACMVAAVPVGAAACVVAMVMSNLLCAIAAAALTSALFTTPAFSCTSTLFRVESTPVRRSKVKSPVMLALIKVLPTPVNTMNWPPCTFDPAQFWKLAKVKLLRLRASCGFVASETLNILLKFKFMSAFIPNCPSKLM